MNILVIAILIILGMVLEFLINHQFTNEMIERLAELSCILLTLAILEIGYRNGEWLISILTIFTLLISSVRKINLGKE